MEQILIEFLPKDIIRHIIKPYLIDDKKHQLLMRQISCLNYKDNYLYWYNIYKSHPMTFHWYNEGKSIIEHYIEYPNTVFTKPFNTINIYHNNHLSSWL